MNTKLYKVKVNMSIDGYITAEGSSKKDAMRAVKKSLGDSSMHVSADLIEKRSVSYFVPISWVEIVKPSKAKK